MRIQRYNSRLSFRKRRRPGCLPSVVLLGVVVGIASFSWNWLRGQFDALVSITPLGVSADDPLLTAIEAFDRGDLTTSIELARQVVTAQPERADAVTLLARALVYRSYTDYQRASDRQAALELTTEAVNRAPTDLDILAIHAFVLQATGQPVPAAEAANRVLERFPDNGLARVALALAYGGVGSFDVALRESQRAVQSGRWQMDALRALAISYSDNGDYDNALKTVQRAIRLHNRLVPLYFERALYALQIGDTDSATEAYYQVLTLDAENVKVRLRLCELSSTLRERDAAIRYCAEVTQRAPSWADGWYQLGREYFLQGNFEAAQEHLHRCSVLQVLQNVPVEKRRFECWYLQGQAAEIRGDCPALLATYNEFLSMTKDTDIQQTWTYPPEGPPICSQN